MRKSAFWDFSGVTMLYVIVSYINTMKNQFIIFCSILTIALSISGCDSGTGNTQQQDVVELQWQSGGSTIYGFIQSYVQTLNSTTPATAYNIGRFNSDGSTAQTYNTSVFSRPVDPSTGETESYAPSIYLSQDGNTIIAQLENDLYRYGTKTNLLEKLQTLVHLIVVSPDLKYAITTSSPGIQPIKTVSVYDITGASARLVTHFDLTNLALEPGVWLNNGTFGVSVSDSVGRHISLFDTLGTLKGMIGGADISFHNHVFFPQTNHLYVRKWSGTSSPVNSSISLVDLSTMTSSTVLNTAVDDFDVTKDEQDIVYSARDTTISTTNGLSIRSINVTSLKNQLIATDIIRIVSLSPAEDKVGYVSGDVNFNQIRVVPFTKP
jgi:hypothetical protein